MARNVIDEFITRYVFEADERGIGRIEAAVDRARRSLESLSRGLFVGGGALTAGLATTGKAIFEFENQLNALEAATLAGADSMAKFRAEARLIGSQTPHTATQAALGLTELAKAGLSTQEVLESIWPTMNMALAGDMPIGDAARGITGIIRGARMDFTTESVQSVADWLATIATNARTTIPEMITATVKAIPLGAAVGIDVRQIMAAVAVLQNAALGPEEAGTGFRNVLLRFLLAPDTEGVVETFEDLGLEAEEMTGMILEGRWLDAMKMLSNADIDERQAAKIFKARTTNMALILKDYVGHTEKLLKLIEESEGNSARMAKTRMKGFPGVVFLVKSIWESLRLSLGDAGLTDFLIDALGLLNRLMLAIISGPIQGQQFIGFLLKMGPLLLGLAFVTRVAAWALAAYIPVMMGAGKAFLWLTAVMRANPFFSLLSAVSLLLLFQDEIAGIVRFIGGLFMSLWHIFNEMMDEIGYPLDVLYKFLRAISHMLGGPAIWEQVKALKDFLSSVFDGFGEGLDTPMILLIPILFMLANALRFVWGALVWLLIPFKALRGVFLGVGLMAGWAVRMLRGVGLMALWTAGMFRVIGVAALFLMRFLAKNPIILLATGLWALANYWKEVNQFLGQGWGRFLDVGIAIAVLGVSILRFLAPLGLLRMGLRAFVVLGPLVSRAFRLMALAALFLGRALLLNPIIAIAVGLWAIAVYWEEITEVMGRQWDRFLDKLEESGIPARRWIDETKRFMDENLSDQAFGEGIKRVHDRIDGVYEDLSREREGIFDWIPDAWEAMMDRIRATLPDWFLRVLGIDTVETPGGTPLRVPPALEDQTRWTPWDGPWSGAVESRARTFPTAPFPISGRVPIPSTQDLSREREGIFDWIPEAWEAMMDRIRGTPLRVPPALEDQTRWTPWDGPWSGAVESRARTFPTDPFPVSGRVPIPSTQDLASLLPVPGLTLPLRAAPPPAAYLSAAALAGGGPPVYRIEIGEVQVDARGGDSREIAQNITQRLRDQIHVIVEKADNQIAR